MDLRLLAVGTGVHAYVTSFATAQQVLPPLLGVAPVAAKLANDGRFTSLVNAVNATGLLPVLTGEGPVTVFAPTNDAFAAAQDVIDSLTADQVKSVLSYHIANGVFFLRDDTTVPTLTGEEVTLIVGQTALKANGASITETALGNDGIIYMLDQVMIPPSLQSPTSAPPPTEPGFSTVQQIIPMGFRGCLEVNGDGSNDDSVKLGSCFDTKSSQEFTYDGTFIHPRGDTTRCLQAGRLGSPADGNYMRVYDCDDNILQKFNWNPTGGPMYLTGEWSDFCVVFRGNVENLDVDPIIVKRCLAVPGPRRGWKVLGY
jgi:uncharacterized surface protein with fasciclin (FAS1) repeats